MKHWGRVDPVPLGMVEHGPLVEVILGPHAFVVQAMVKAGLTPQSARAKMMVDTGAQRTVVDEAIARALGLQPIRYEMMVGVSQKPEPCPVYMMSVALGMDAGHAGTVLVQFNAEIVGMPTPGAAQMHNGLLGRDFLLQFKFVYDGPAGSFHLTGEGMSTGAPKKPQQQAKRKRR